MIYLVTQTKTETPWLLSQIFSYESGTHSWLELFIDFFDLMEAVD